MNKFFKELDLSNKEFVIYKTLLRLKNPSIRAIAEHSGINRGTTHELLKTLLKKGLVTHQLQGKRKLFVAEPPEKLKTIVETKSKSLESINSLLTRSIIPTLNNQRYVSQKPTARYYYGEEGAMQVLQDVLNTMRKENKKEYYAFSALPIREHLYTLMPNFTKLRIRYEITVKVIAMGQGGELTHLSQRKWLKVDSPGSYSSYIIIYADKLALISLTKEELPYAVVIQETGITEAMKLIFNTLWRLL